MLGTFLFHRGAPRTNAVQCDALIVGCARSGTSILGELVAAHPSVRYLFEATNTWELAGSGAGGSHRLDADDAIDAVCRKIRRRFGQKLDSTAPGTLVVEKSPRNTLRIPFVRRVFPAAKLIHIIRDGRDVACSLLPGVGGDEWHHLKPPGWEDITRNHTGIERCAVTWRSVMEIALQDLQDVPHLEIRYERLVCDPTAVAAELIDYLGLDQSDQVREFAKRIQDRTEKSYHAQHQSRWYTGSHARRLGRWRECLSEDDQRRVATQLGPMLDRLGYKM